MSSSLAVRAAATNRDDVEAGSPAVGTSRMSAASLKSSEWAPSGYVARNPASRSLTRTEPSQIFVANSTAGMPLSESCVAPGGATGSGGSTLTTCPSSPSPRSCTNTKGTNASAVNRPRARTAQRRCRRCFPRRATWSAVGRSGGVTERPSSWRRSSIVVMVRWSPCGR